MGRSLYVTDLDGTLLDSNGVLSGRAAELLNALVRDRGVWITYATSRSPEKARALLRAARFELPAIVLNGAMLVDPKTGESLEAAPIPDTAAQRRLARLESDLRYIGRDPERVPVVFQLNKRDLIAVAPPTGPASVRAATRCARPSHGPGPRATCRRSRLAVRESPVPCARPSRCSAA